MAVRAVDSNRTNKGDGTAVDALQARVWLHAINRLAAVVELNPSDAEAIRGIAMAHNALGDATTACWMLGRAIEAAPDFGDAHRDMAVLLADEGRVLEAANSAIRALEIDPCDEDAMLLLSNIRAYMCGTQTSREVQDGSSQAQVDACLSRINSVLARVSSVECEANDLRKAA